MIQETVEFVQKYEIDGIHIDNAESVPQYFDLNIEELTRRENDGERSCSKEDLFYGDIVLPDTESGYWATEYDLSLFYYLHNYDNDSFQKMFANPFYLKLCKTLWQHFPNFIFIGDVIGGRKFKNREENLILSGIIPRLYTLPQALASIFGKYLHQNGTITEIEKQAVNSLRSWYEGLRGHNPSGSIVIQSTTSHAFPYPAYLFQRATWSVIDLFFFMPDLPMTFLGEDQGHAFRIKTVNNFRREIEGRECSPTTKRSGVSKSVSDMKTMAFETNEENPHKEKIVESHSLSEKERMEDIINGDNLFVHKISPEYGFDLRKIKSHYEHRRKLRHEKPVLRDGRHIPLLAEHERGVHDQVIAFARIPKHAIKQFAIVAINFNDFEVYFHVNLMNLQYISKDMTQKLDKAVVKIEDWAGDTMNDCYTLYEFFNGKIETSLKVKKLFL